MSVCKPTTHLVKSAFVSARKMKGFCRTVESTDATGGSQHRSNGVQHSSACHRTGRVGSARQRTAELVPQLAHNREREHGGEWDLLVDGIL
eukprot:6877279-Prymnesium_polylepis.1